MDALDRTPPKANRKAGSLFAYSPLDALLVTISLAQLGLIVWGALNFPGHSLLGVCLLFVALTFLGVTHHDVVTHDFIHTPFFSSRALNSLYAAVSSIFVMQPCTLMGLEHLAHHRHGNDTKDAVSGTTKDATSTYRFSTDGSHEPLWRYALLSPFREWASARQSFQMAIKSHARRQIAAEATFLAAFWITIIWIDWQFAVFYLGVVYAAHVGASAQNYFEHYGAIPGNRKADSVSCYDPVYNFIWFNNGYHQEHHYRPAVHWTKLRELRGEMLPADQRRVVTGAHFMNLPWLGKKRLAGPSAMRPHAKEAPRNRAG